MSDDARKTPGDDCAALNALPDEAAREQLTRCCGAQRWVDAMLAERPFRDRAHLFEAAGRHWWVLERADWLEAFGHHPRIGELTSLRPVAAGTAGWAASEQAGAARAGDAVRAALAEGNRTYEARFGHVYLVCATGKTGDEMLAILRRRLGNDAAAELRVAAGEQEKITRIRLEKLLAQ